MFATVTDAVGVGLAGCSIEDFSGNSDAPIYDAKLAVERVATAVDAARTGAGLVLIDQPYCSRTRQESCPCVAEQLSCRVRDTERFAAKVAGRLTLAVTLRGTRVLHDGLTRRTEEKER